jgi:Ca2+-binding RTX toxin-like protein
MPTLNVLTTGMNIYAAFQMVEEIENATIDPSAVGVQYNLGPTRILAEGSSLSVVGPTPATKTISGGTVNTFTLSEFVTGSGYVNYFRMTDLGINGDTLTDAILADRTGGANQAAIENLFTGLDWTINGSAGDDIILVQAGNSDDGVSLELTGNNTWNLDLFNDRVRGGTGVDTMFGNAGQDRLDGNKGNDCLFGGIDYDTLTGGDGNDSLSAGANGALMYGGIGNDTLRGSTDLAAATAFGGDGNDVIYGGNGASTLNGDANDDLVKGNGGNDTIDGGDGMDLLAGGIGNDSVSGGAGIDKLWGDDNDDNLWGEDGADSIYGGWGQDSISGGKGVDLIKGDGGVDTIYGGEDGDSIYGGGDGDNVSGGIGSDFIWGDGGNDSLYGDIGMDNLWGGDGADRLFGGSDADALSGGAANDVLQGGDGWDALRGGTGIDTMTGGWGDDTFIFTALNEMGNATRDIITDFTSGEDVVDLSALDLTWRGTLGFTGANQARWWAGGSCIVIETTGDGIVDYRIRLDGVTTLASGDVLV